MSGLFFGGFAAPAVAGFRIQSSVLGLPIPVVYGRARVSGNLIHLLDQTRQPVGGKAASKSGSAQYTYRAAVMLAIAEGPIAGIIRGWTDKDGVKLFSAYASDGWSLAYGSSSQAAWTYLSSLHSTEAVPYQFVAYVANTTFDMPSGVLPNLSWEVDGFLAVGGGILDANPKDILVDVVTDVNHGLALPASLFGNLTPYHDFCLAADLLVSPAFTALRPARDSLAELFQASCSVPIWSDGTLKVVPYCDAPMTGNGVTYTPNTTPLYDLTDDQFLRTGDAPPVSVQRTAAADAHNQFFVAYEDRLTGLGPTFLTSYSPGVAEAKDQASLELGFFRPASTIQLPMIKRAAVAQYVAQMAMQRELNVRNTYRFQLGWKFSLLEPMDLVTLTDAGLGLSRTPVRIVEVHDLDGDAGIDIIAEDWPFGTATAARYTTQVGSGTAASQGVDPGNTATPAITAGPRALGTDPFQIWIAAGGGALWGGCEVWLSTDGTQYYQVGTLTSRGTYGTLTAALPAGPALPATDATNTLAVDVTVSGGALQSGVAADVAALLTLCAVGDEYVTFTTATLTSALHYALTGLGRGAYRTNHGYHAAGSAFLRCNDAVLKMPFDQGVDGQVLYLKFPAFNLFGRGRQSLASVSAVTYTIVRPDRMLPQLAPFARIDGATTVAFSWTRNARTNAVWVYDSLIAVGAADPYDSGAASPTVLTAGTDAYTAQIPPQGKERRLHFAPVDLNGTASNVIDFDVYAPNTMTPVGQPRAVFNTNRDAVDVYVALTSPASETITASFRDSEAAGAPVYALCVSGSDATPLYVASGTEIGPTSWFTNAGVQTQRLAAIALKRDQITRLYFLMTGKPSGAQGTAQLALSMKEQPWLESIAATWNAATGTYDVVLVGGANCVSVNIEIADNAAFTSPTAYSAALADGGSLSHSFALSGAQLGKLWFARGTPYNAVTLGGLAGTPQQDSDYIPANPGLAILAVQATPAGGPYTGISIPFTFSGMPSGVTFDVSYDNGGGNIDSSTGNTASPVTFTPGVVFNAVGGAPGKGSITITAQGPAGTIKTATRYKPYLT